jgi:hypothetical protein
MLSVKYAQTLFFEIILISNTSVSVFARFSMSSCEVDDARQQTDKPLQNTTNGGDLKKKAPNHVNTNI